MEERLSMRTEFTIENYYSRNAWDYDRAIKRAGFVLESFDETNIPTDITSILELYNIHLLLDGEAKQQHLDFFSGEEYGYLSQAFMSIVAKFFCKIDVDNIVQYAEGCYIDFWNDFWNLIVKFKVYKRIDKFPWVAEECKLPLYKMLQYKEMVRDLGLQCSEYMRQSDQTGETLIKYYLRKHEHGDKLFVPDEFSKQDKKNAVNAYIGSNHVNPNVLTLIIEAPKNMEQFPIDDRMKRDAKHRMKHFFGDNSRIHVLSQGIKVGASFEKNIPEIVRFNYSNNVYEVKYNIDWIKENIDYPTLLNNFIYLFKYVDMSMRCQFIETKATRSAIEDAFIVKGIKSYIHGHSFRIINMLASAQMGVYYRVLSDQNIEFEDVIKWFFQKYLCDEFEVNGFVCNMPKGSNDYLTKCKMIVSAMDGIAKQYRMYLEDGCIDRELYEQSSEHIRFELLGSFQNMKYIYCDNQELLMAQNALFSDQSHLFYIEKTKGKYRSLADLLMNEKITLEDFYEHQRDDVKQLIRLGIIKEGKGFLELSIPQVSLLHEFYSQEVICYYYRESEILDQWIQEKKVIIENTLFSKNEADYINFMLNQAEFSNGHDLRNKYTHDTCPLDEVKQKQDYIELLKIMILIIIKINEEFCNR